MSQNVPPSKTRRKQAMLALQDLGTELTRLSDQQLEQVDMPEILREAVLEARRINGFEACRRQMQYIGRLMRDIDPAPIRARLDTWRSASRAQTTHLHLIERWRGRLLADDTALDAFRNAYPEADAQRLETLIRGTHHESAAGKPPKNFRALFRELKQVLDEYGATVEP